MLALQVSQLHQHGRIVALHCLRLEAARLVLQLPAWRALRLHAQADQANSCTHRSCTHWQCMHSAQCLTPQAQQGCMPVCLLCRTSISGCFQRCMHLAAWLAHPRAVRLTCQPSVQLVVPPWQLSSAGRAWAACSTCRVCTAAYTLPDCTTCLVSMQLAWCPEPHLLSSRPQQEGPGLRAPLAGRARGQHEHLTRPFLLLCLLLSSQLLHGSLCEIGRARKMHDGGPRRRHECICVGPLSTSSTHMTCRLAGALQRLPAYRELQKHTQLRGDAPCAAGSQTGRARP